MVEILSNPWLFAAISGLAGAVLTIAVQRVLNKRGLLTYAAVHNRVGMSAEDTVFGSVQVTWNGNPIANLFISTIEMRNESLRDFEGVTVRVWTTSALLLTERTEIPGTIQGLEWTPAFAERLAIPPGAEPSPEQFALVRGQRDYLIPTLNRGQVIRFTFLNAAESSEAPSIWLDVLHPGVKLKYRVVPQEFLGVPQPAAALAGTLLGLVVVPVIVTSLQNAWVIAVLAFVYGVLVLLPGALMLKLWRWARDSLGD